MYCIYFGLITSFLFNFFYLLEGHAMTYTSDIQFSIIEKKTMKEFEKEIAYFFGVSHPEPVIDAYIKALKKLEELGSHASFNLLEEEIVPYLEMAYQEISRQRGWNFNSHQAAKIELQIILGNSHQASFETVQNLMTNLYTLVFQSDSPLIRKAAMLRTFLYQYKVDILKRERDISKEDQALMIGLAKTSESYLNAIQ